MNKNKIISTILVSTMLADIAPAVNASVVEVESVIEDGFVESESTENVIIEDSKNNQDIEEDNSNNVNSSNKEDNLIENITPDTSLEDENIEEEKDVSNESAYDDNEEIKDDVDFDANEDNSENEILNEEVSEDNMKDSAIISPAENNSSDELSKSIVVNNDVIEVTLGENQYVPNLTGDIGKYTTIKVITTGGKKLVTQDYDNLRNSKIPNVDLSNAKSDSIPGNAFRSATHLKNFKFPIGVKVINNNAFYDCKGLTGNLIIPDSVTSIGSNAFRNCSSFTGDLAIPDSVTSIGYAAFWDCSGFTGNLVISNSLTSIGDAAFWGCSGFTGDLIIPNSVTYIGYDAFVGCSGLTNLIIGNSVTEIGIAAINGCHGLNKIIFAVNDSFENSSYRERLIFLFDLAQKDKVIVEMPYDFDTSGTWIDSLNENQKGKPRIKSESATTNIDKNTSISLYIPTPYKEENIKILKDGESFDLPQKNADDKYIFNEEGIYNITITTNLGTVSNIDFEIVSWVNNPTIEYNNDLVSIFDNGHHIYKDIDGIENFDDISNIKYTFSNNNWEVINGTLKSEAIDYSQSTENSFKVNAQKGDKLKILVKVFSESTYDRGYIYLNGKQIYNKGNKNSTYDIVELDLIEGENIINFKYEKGRSQTSYEDAMFIDLIEFLPSSKELDDIDRVEYRLNNGEWVEYLGSFRIPDEFVNGVDEIKVEARIIVKDKVSKTTEYSLIIPKAQLEAENVKIIQGDNFDENNIATAIDIDGSDISDRITIASSNVKIDTPGEYTITYKVEASNGYFTEKEIKVTVLPLTINKPTIECENNIVTITDNGNNSINSLNEIEYRINSSEWTKYSSEFRIPDNFVNGVDPIKIEARAVAKDKSSDINEISVMVLKAEINAEDIELTEGDSFKELDYVTAIDIDGNDISDRVAVVSNNVKINKPGTYKVVYRVQASNGYFTEKEIKVTVLKKKLPPVINTNNITLSQGSKFNPLDFITVVDDEGNLIDKSKIEIVENTVNTSKPGKYIITYKVEEDNGLVTTKTIDVVVKEVSSNNNGSSSNQNKIPNAGGNASLLYLSSIMSIIGGCIFIGKKKKKH